MRISRDLVVVVVLLALLAGLTAVLGVRQAEAEQAKSSFLPWSSHSATPSGTLGLYNWLGALGYRVERIEGDSFNLDPAARTLVILSIREEFTDGEVREVREWTERGNTLVLCDSSPRRRKLWQALGADVATFSTRSGDLPLEQPVIADRALRVSVDAASNLKLTRNDYVTYLSDAGGEPLLVRFPQGQGQVWLCTTPGLFSNEALRDDGNAAFVSALFAAAPRGSAIEFDEFHLDVGRPAPSLNALLVRTPWGWAVLLTFALLFGYLVLNGRRLGRVAPLPQTLARRSPAEYVYSMAQLFRRGDKRAMAQRHYRQQLKRRLARPYGLNPELPDPEFVEALARQRENLDAAALLQTLQQLSRPRVDDRALVKLAAQASAFEARPHPKE